MKLRPVQYIGLLFVLVMGARLAMTLTRPKPVTLPPSLFLHNNPPLPLPPMPAVTPPPALPPLAELAAPPAPAPTANTPPPPPPPPAFRASKPGADQFQPLPFPKDVTEPFTPEGFKQHLEHALKECPMGAMELVSMDCKEFPCMALTELKDETARQANLNSCMPWIEIYEGGTQYVASTQKREGQEFHYMTWVPLPPHTADAKLVMLRSHRRSKALVKAFTSK
ncbi:hypothetical protein [Hyalangium rubrum]|uniref:Uncharacterized protein n=1 Tax=Hyalangium rubrum TaxID=3103134 RepID=A0ABU5GVB2_9BACT|nr:hypothetical protein [Hyalangium sp. s54d21]MDY7225110.1 hypothetical protein [Hyalangium sp. s54d21]